MELSSTKETDSVKDMKVSRNVGKENGSKVNLGLALEIGDQCLSCIGQWSQYEHNVSVNPPGIYPDLWTQTRIWPGRFRLQENQQKEG